jgi:hypothetical protein
MRIRTDESLRTENDRAGLRIRKIGISDLRLTVAKVRRYNQKRERLSDMRGSREKVSFASGASHI